MENSKKVKLEEIFHYREPGETLNGFLLTFFHIIVLVALLLFVPGLL